MKKRAGFLPVSSLSKPEAALPGASSARSRNAIRVIMKGNTTQAGRRTRFPFLRPAGKEVLCMKPMKRTADRVLFALFLVSFAAYCAVFLSTFARLPLNISSLHQGLLLFAHFIPAFFLELLLCRIAAFPWRLLLPALPLLAAGLWFLSRAEWYLMAWVLFLFWCIAPLAGCLTAQLVFAISRRLKKRRTGAPSA